MVTGYFIFMLGCIAVNASYSGFYYSIPPPLVYSAPSPFNHHTSPFFAPLINYQFTQPGSSSIQHEVKPNNPIDSNTYHGFIYKTHFDNEATSNVFFLTGSGANQKEEIEKFIVSARNIMSNQITPKANLENVSFEKMRPISEITKEIFGDQPQGFHYIFNSDSLPKERSLNVPITQRFSNEVAEAGQGDKSNESNPSEESTKGNKEMTTEKKTQTENSDIAASSTTAKSSTK